MNQANQKGASRILSGISLLFSLIIVLGSQTFLSPCVHEDGSFGACHWAGQALLGLGMLAAAISLCALLLPSLRSGLLCALIPCAVVGILTPGTLISLCGMASMRCRSVMQPAMTLLWVGVLIVAGVALVLHLREVRK